MPAIPALSVEGWNEVRKAYEIGVDPSALSQEYGVTLEAIRKRKQREGWLTLQSIENQAQAMREKREQTQGLSRNVPKAEEVAGKSLVERGERHAIRVFEAASAALERSLPTLPDPDNWKTAAIADQMARRAAGMDKQASVTVNVGGLFGGMAEGVTLEVESGEPLETQQE